MNAEELKARFKEQFNEALDAYTKNVPDHDAPDLIPCAMAAGMLQILSALKMFDGPSIAYQITIMHAALREVGKDRGWFVEANKDGG